MILKFLIQYLEEKVPLSIQESYDNCGLILGNQEMEIIKILITLDITEEVLLEAIALGANLIISHHPILFKGIRTLSPLFSSDRIITMAIKNDMAIYAMHTNLDKIYGGVSFQMASILELDHISFLKTEYNSSYSIGLGATGYLKNPMYWKEYANILKEKMKLKVIRHTRDYGELIRKIGVFGGSGSSSLQEAINAECQLYISADFKYHQFFIETDSMMVADIGHYESEQFCLLLIERFISEKFPTFAISLTKLNTNPIYYSY